jgi:hypothetical protein
MPDDGADGVVAKSKGTFTKKVGPLPVWGWVAVAFGGYLFYRWRKGSQASSAAGSPSQALNNPSALGYATGGSNPGGYDSSSTDSFLQYLQQALQNAQNNQNGPTFSSFANELLRGSGFNPPGNNPEGVLTNAQGSFQWIPTAGAASALQKAGQSIYFQPTAGTFMPVSDWTTLAPGTALFAGVPQPVANIGPSGTNPFFNKQLGLNTPVTPYPIYPGGPLGPGPGLK